MSAYKLHCWLSVNPSSGWGQQGECDEVAISGDTPIRAGEQWISARSTSSMFFSNGSSAAEHIYCHRSLTGIRMSADFTSKAASLLPSLSLRLVTASPQPFLPRRYRERRSVNPSIPFLHLNVKHTAELFALP